MTIKNKLEEIEKDVKDVTKTGFVYNDTKVVPNALDGELTYESGAEKKGKKIETCVLYVDIRNSVALTEKHHTQTMGRVYTAFTKAVLKVARHHSGHTRNIIGDRIMIVFPSTNCYTNAVNCAISINHIAKKIINEQFADVDFKCGIGIDFGELRVIKVGIQRQGTEKGENKGLVWVGYPANIASRLTDVANKSIEEKYFEILRNPINPRALRPFIELPSIFGGSTYDPQAPLYLSNTQTIEMSGEDFIEKITNSNNGELSMLGGKVVSFTKKTRINKYPAIMMTSEVFNGYKKADPNGNDILNNFWKEQKHKIKNVDSKIYGGDVNWTL